VLIFWIICRNRQGKKVENPRTKATKQVCVCVVSTTSCEATTDGHTKSQSKPSNSVRVTTVKKINYHLFYFTRLTSA